MPSMSKRVKTEESPGGPLSSTPPDPLTMAMYYSKLNAFRPWSPAKGGFPPPLGGYPLQHPFRGPLPEASLEVRRPEEINQSSLERYRRDREHDSSPQSSSKRKFSEKGKVWKASFLLTKSPLTLPNSPFHFNSVYRHENR